MQMDPSGTTPMPVPVPGQQQVMITWSSSTSSSSNTPDEFVQDRPSFSCSFCKKGFSNAQALGGHMNIHRRDRANAKLKELEEFSQENNLILSLDISRTASNSDPDHNEKVVVLDNDISPDTDCLHPLFTLAEAPPLLPVERTASPHDEKSDTSGSGGGNGVDLELRLGPEPHDAKATGNR